jgi:hypothetical protein
MEEHHLPYAGGEDLVVSADERTQVRVAHRAAGEAPELEVDEPVGVDHTGALVSEHLGPLSGQGTVALAQLSAGDFPYLAESAAVAQGITADDEFRGGLAAVLRGLRP